RDILITIVILSLSLHFQPILSLSHFFFFTDTATTEIYTLSLHDALPISYSRARPILSAVREVPKHSAFMAPTNCTVAINAECFRSEEHTSELQSPYDLVCRLLLEKKKKNLKLQQLK